MKTFMKSLNTQRLPKFEPYWNFDFVSIWLETNFSNEPNLLNKLFNTFKEGLILRDGINIENFFKVVDEIFESDYQRLGDVSKKYPLNGVCCVEWNQKISATEVKNYCLNDCQKYVIIFEGKDVGECYDFKSQY